MQAGEARDDKARRLCAHEQDCVHIYTNTAGKRGLKGQRPLLGGMAWAMDLITLALESHGLKGWLRNGRYLCSYLHSALPSSFRRAEAGAPSSVVCAALQHLESCEHDWFSWFRVGSWRPEETGSLCFQLKVLWLFRSSFL